MVYQCAHEKKATCGDGGQEAAYAGLMELTRGPLAGEDEEAKVLALGALGNSGSPKMLPMMQEMANEPSGLIRNSVAHALRRVRTPESRRLLTEFANDRSSSVQGAAFRALEEDKNLDAETISAIQDRVRNQPLTKKIVPSALAILARTRPAGWEKDVERIADSPESDRRSRGRAREILALYGAK